MHWRHTQQLRGAHNLTMTTFLYTTTSTGGEPTDIDAVQALLDNYTIPDDLTVTLTSDYLDIRGADTYSSFDVYDQRGGSIVTEQFLHALQPYLATKLTIKCAQTQGYGDLAMYKWVVGPDTDPTLVTL